MTDLEADRPVAFTLEEAGEHIYWFRPQEGEKCPPHIHAMFWADGRRWDCYNCRVSSPDAQRAAVIKKYAVDYSRP